MSDSQQQDGAVQQEVQGTPLQVPQQSNDAPKAESQESEQDYKKLHTELRLKHRDKVEELKTKSKELDSALAEIETLKAELNDLYLDADGAVDAEKIRKKEISLNQRERELNNSIKNFTKDKDAEDEKRMKEYAEKLHARHGIPMDTLLKYKSAEDMDDLVENILEARESKEEKLPQPPAPTIPSANEPTLEEGLKERYPSMYK